MVCSGICRQLTCVVTVVGLRATYCGIISILMLGPDLRTSDELRRRHGLMHASEMRAKTVDAPFESSIFLDKRAPPATSASSPLPTLSPTRALPSSPNPISPKIYWPAALPTSDVDSVYHIGGSAGMSAAYASSTFEPDPGALILLLSHPVPCRRALICDLVRSRAVVCAARPPPRHLRHGRYRPASHPAAGAYRRSAEAPP